MLSKSVQPRNEKGLIEVTLDGILIDVKPIHSEMLVTLPSVGIILFLQPKTRFLLAVSIKQFPALW